VIKSEYFALFIYVIASTAGVVVIKKFLDTIVYENMQGFFVQLFNTQLIFGVALYIFGFLTWLFVLSRLDLSIAYPVAITLSFIAVILTSAFVLKENVTLNIVAGMVLCIIGVLIILR
jgi:drug/metabolite transporter (DMT)-like permease